MRRSRSAGLATLVRWRGFQESRSAISLGQASQAMEAAADSLQHARGRLEELDRQRLDLLQAPELDLARLQVGASIEDFADRQVRDEEAGFKVAQAAHAEACHLHAQARAQTRVAEIRYARVASAEADRGEKMMFDWMADLRSAQGAN